MCIRHELINREGHYICTVGKAVGGGGKEAAIVSRPVRLVGESTRVVEKNLILVRGSPGEDALIRRLADDLLLKTDEGTVAFPLDGGHVDAKDTHE